MTSEIPRGRPIRRAPRPVNAALGLGLAGLVAGALLEPSGPGALGGAVIGALFGLGWAAIRRAEEALARLEERVAAIERADASARAPDRAPAALARAAAEAPPSAPSAAPAPPAVPVEIAPAAHYRPPPPSGPGRTARAFAALRGLLLGGNTVVRVGILVLLIGVSLLAKWAADHALFPIEARLAAAAAIGLALVAIGLRLREARPGFATTLQGGGVAALYLVVFFAYRIFALVPAPLAFALFAGIALACGTLAVLQRSEPLLFIGSIGGFLAPILASTGEGNHVVLFGYYLLLDVGVAAVAWHRSWRAANLLAFFCTYGVATFWGVVRYRPEHFASTEPFLLAYLVLFTGVALVHAWRQPPRLAGLVDGTLVFGTPLVTLLAQARLVGDRPFAMAISTAGFGLFYAALATAIWSRAPESLRRVGEAFVALAVVFGTIAIPLALDDGLTTTLVWALEGAGIYWVGARQGRALARWSGVGLQALAALAFAWAAWVSGFATRVGDFLPIANPRFLAGAAIAAAGLFIAREAWALRDRMRRAEWQLAQALGAWALAWWAGACIAEIDQFVAGEHEVAAALLAAAATFAALERAAAWADWRPGRLLSLAVIPAGYWLLAVAVDVGPHLLADGGALAWPLWFASLYAVLARIEGIAPWTRFAYAPALWLAALAAGYALSGMTAVPLALAGDWPLAAFGAGFAAVALAAGLALERGVGPFARFPAVALGPAGAPLAALAALGIVASNLHGRGDAAPLPYLPLLSPADAAIALLALALVDWWIRLRRARPPVLPGAWRSGVTPALVALAFVWGNGVLVRSVHQWTEVAWRADALWESTPLQAALSIGWTLAALGGMLWCTRRGRRGPWIAAATLLGVTVVKLFAVDLSTLSTGAKIGTFLVVGALLLVVGYLSPVPPGEPARPRGGAALEEGGGSAS